MRRSELEGELAAALGARHEARFIVEEVLGAESPPGQPLSPADADAARALAVRRSSGEPLQYVLGHWAFRQLDLVVDDRVLIPRPETEQVTEVALAEVAQVDAPHPVMVDAGTGSGAIALALATELADRYPTGRVYAVDSSAEALAVAAENLRRVRRARDGSMLAVSLTCGSWLDALPADLRTRVNLVVSNPPYVDAAEWSGVPPDVQCEPQRALLAGAGTGGTPGQAGIEAVLRQAARWLSRPGSVVIEVAPHQAGPSARLARSLGFEEVHVEADLAGHPRTLVGRAR